MKAIAGALILCTVYVNGYGFNNAVGHSWITGALVGIAFVLIVSEFGSGVTSDHDDRP